MAPKWFKLDNAAKLYPAVSSSSWGSVFRVSVQLDKPIDRETLQKAVNDTMPRFPSMNVRLHKGMFWFYMEENSAPLTVQPEVGHPCMRFVLNREPITRISYFRDRINAEFFHSVTDGTGGMVLIKTLTARYLELQGHRVIYDHGAKNIKEPPSKEETDDTFLRMKLPKFKQRAKMSRAWHYPGAREMRHTLYVISARMDSEQIRTRAKAMDATITEYMTAVILYTSYQEQMAASPAKTRPVRVQVPVNMRGFEKTETLRNFSTYVIPEIDPALGEYTFEEVVKTVRGFMRYAVDEKLLKREIAQNVSDEKHLLVRLAPLTLKNWIVNMVYTQSGDRIVTTTLSNLGRIEMPTGTEKYVKDAEFLLGPAREAISNCSMLSMNGQLRLAFTRNMAEPALARRVLRFLRSEGVDVSVRSNEEEN